MMRYLAISILLLLFTSCALQTTKGLVAVKPSKNIVTNNYFSDKTKDYVYKAKINAYNHDFGGILIIKKIDSLKHRVVFTTEFGNKLFDFLYEDETFKKIYIIKKLDKKLIVKTLRKDFKLLISEKISAVTQYETKDSEIYKTLVDKQNNFYFFNKKKHTLDKIVNTTKFKEKVEIQFTDIKKQNANSIFINHKNIKLTIALKKF